MSYVLKAMRAKVCATARVTGPSGIGLAQARRTHTGGA